MRVALLVCVLLISHSVAAAELELSVEAGGNWASCDYPCPSAPQVALRIARAFGQHGSLGLRLQHVHGPDDMAYGVRQHNRANRTSAALLEFQTHTAGTFQLTASLAAGVGEIVNLHGDRDVEIGSVYGSPLFLAQAAAGARVVAGSFFGGFEGRFTDWPSAVHGDDTWASVAPRQHRTSSASASFVVVAGARF